MQTFMQKQNQPQRRVATSLAWSNTAAPGLYHRADLIRHLQRLIRHLQRTIGNQSVQRTLQANAEELNAGFTGTTSPCFGYDLSRVPVGSHFTGVFRTKLAVNQPGDKYEQEADRVSERVMRMPESEQHGTFDGAEKQTATSQLDETTLPSSVHEVLSESGEPLDPATRSFMEPRFGQNFAHVRVHTNSRGSAEAVNALAYTAGNHVVFRAGQYAPTSSQGQRLLAHELTHVVQQNEGLRSEAVGRHNISRAPVVLSRKTPTTKEEAVKQHEADQRVVADLLEKARKIQLDPKKNYRDPDNLYRNTVELLDTGRLTLTILSPTHKSPTLHFDTRFRFDAQGNHFGGDYPKVPIDGLDGVVENKESAFGVVNLPSAPSSPVTIQTLPPKVERAPGETAPAPEKAKPAPTLAPPTAPAPFTPGDIRYFTRGLAITEAQFKNTFVHEGQHIADLSPKKPVATSANDKLEAYKSEFRAFWIQPPLPRMSQLAPESIDRLPEPTGKAVNADKLTLPKGKVCKVCTPPNASAPAEVKTELKNPRQEAIFLHIMTRYQDQQYDCCYIYDESFRKEVNRFAYPESVNLINSVRLINLNLELPMLNTSMTSAQVKSTNLVALLARLDALDWAFLNDPKLSKPFWDALKNAAPGFVDKGINTLAKRATKKPVTAADVDKALSGK